MKSEHNDPIENLAKAIISEFYIRLEAIARNELDNVNDAEPIVLQLISETVIKAHKGHIDILKDTDLFSLDYSRAKRVARLLSPYLMRGMRIACWAENRRSIRTPNVGHTIGEPNCLVHSPVNLPEFEMVRIEAQQIVRRVLENLHEREREILLLSVEDGLSASQIASLLLMNPSTVRTCLQRTKSKLRKNKDFCHAYDILTGHSFQKE